VIDAVAATGLFDAAYYVLTNADVAAGGWPPLEHYIRVGEPHGRQPNPYFDPAHYWLGAAGLDPPPAFPLLLHYRLVGEAAGVSPGPFFDPVWYRQRYGIADEASPLADYLACADRNIRLPSPALYAVPWLTQYRSLPREEDRFARYLEDVPDASARREPDSGVIADAGVFDSNHYLINGSDVHAAGLDPIQHFCGYGWREGRSPDIYFDTRWYLQTNAHVAALGINPLVHYLLEGETAGRRPVVYFDPIWYRGTYGVPARQSALAHFLTHRRSQLFSPHPEFDLDWYLRTYGEEVGPNRDPFAHYLMSGTYADVSPSTAFDWSAYRRRTRGRRTRHFQWTLDPTRDNPLIHKLHAEYR
jgi:hypothetical protein